MSNYCEHEWVMYEGFRESFEHCKKCGLKKSEYEIPLDNSINKDGKSSVNNPWFTGHVTLTQENLDKLREYYSKL